MKRYSKSTTPPEAVVPNAVAGSCPERSPVQPSDNEMQTEPAAASSPNSEVFDLPPSEFGDDLTTRYFVSRALMIGP